MTSFTVVFCSVRNPIPLGLVFPVLLLYTDKMQCTLVDGFACMYNLLILVFSFCIFSQFKFNGNLISCEDDVIVNSNKNECFIGHVEKIYELEGSDEPNRAIIQWYFSYKELLKLAKWKITVDTAEPWRELFLPSCDSVHNHGVEDIDAETISRKCTVLRLKPHDLLPDCLQTSDQEDLFYVRHRFDRHFNLHPVNKRASRESTSKKECSIKSRVKTPNTFRRESTRNQNLVKENHVRNNAKTPQARKTPAKGKGTESSQV